MVVQEHFNDLVIATYGRGFWIMDDVTPFQQLTADVLASDAHLFSPRPAYRMHDIVGGPGAIATANINYFLKDAPTGPVTIEILDSRGQTVNTLRGTRNGGINRVSWNLRYEGPQQARIRTKPPANPTVVEEKRFRTQWERDGWIPVLSWGTGGGFSGVVVAPGTYTVKLTAGGKALTRDLVVLKDPRSEGTLEDIQAQVALQLEIRDDITTTSGMINDIESMKKQLNDLMEAMGRTEALAQVRAEATRLYEKLQGVEDMLLQPVAVEGDSKSFRYPNMLYSKLSVLGGDLASSVDFAPNEQQRAVHQLLKSQMLEYQIGLRSLVGSDEAAFNRMLRERSIGVIIVPSGLD